MWRHGNFNHLEYCDDDEYSDGNELDDVEGRGD